MRRAISTAYYAVFHFILAATADEFVGVTKRKTARYALVYRSVDHRALRTLCDKARKQTLAPKYQKHVPRNGLGANIQAFSDGLIELQQKRHSADYDPSFRVKTSDAKLAIATARSAISRFQRANDLRRRTFLTLLLFSPR